MLILYTNWLVVRDGVVIGELTAPKDKAAAWAAEDYGPGVTLLHGPSHEHLRIGGKA